MSLHRRDPPSLLNLAISAAVLNVQHIPNLNSIPDAIVVDLFKQKTLASGKLTEPVLKVFMATGNPEVLYIVKGLNIQPIYLPVLPTSERQLNPSTSGDAGGDHNEDYGNEYGPPLPTQEELREMEHLRLVGEVTNMILNFAKDPKLAKYMIETAFQDVHAQWKETTTSPPKLDTKKQYSEKELEEEVEARLAQIFDAHKKGKKRKKSTDFLGYLGCQSTFDKAKSTRSMQKCLLLLLLLTVLQIQAKKKKKQELKQEATTRKGPEKDKKV
ncbi:hypothetical protein L7F22_031901 [Adiantum nelumboides]|nr:hypothetical protein [Adiantum nelumboides]